MQWDEFYEKARYDWSASTTTNRISRLEVLGPPEEVADLVEYYMDGAGMVRLINKAISANMIFTGEQVTNMAGCLDETHADTIVSYALKKNVEFTPAQAIELTGAVSLPVMNQVASRLHTALTYEQLEDLDGCIDDEILRKLAGDYIRPEEDVDDEVDDTAKPQHEIAAAVADHDVYPVQRSEKKSLFQMLFRKKYRYVFVLFQSAEHAYSYRTEDKSIKQGDIVMVPVAGKDPQPAYVSEVRIVPEDHVPYPLDQTRMVIGKADRKTRKRFAMNDNRIPIDISCYRIGTPSGVIEVTTTEAERKMLREKYEHHPKLKTIETREPAQPHEAMDWINEVEAADALFDNPELGADTSALKDIRRKQVKQAVERAEKKKNKDDFWRGAGEVMFVDDTLRLGAETTGRFRQGRI